MPIYQYRCRECGEDLEVAQSFTDDALTECPACGGPLRKVFAAPGISFKGSGFYKNDSRSTTKSGVNGSPSDKGEKAAKAEKAEKAEKADSSTKKTETTKGAKGDATTDSGSKTKASTSS